MTHKTDEGNTYDATCLPKHQMTAERRALQLFTAGQYPFAIKELLLDEFPDLSEYEIEQEIDDALIIHREKDIPTENYSND